MKRFILLGICVAFLLCGCASSRVTTSFPPAAQPQPVVRLHRNMTPEEVVQLMGTPDRPVTIYFYNTGEKDSYLGRFSKDNSTPLVFVDDKLAGWGWNFLNGATKRIMNN